MAQAHKGEQRILKLGEPMPMGFFVVESFSQEEVRVEEYYVQESPEHDHYSPTLLRKQEVVRCTKTYLVIERDHESALQALQEEHEELTQKHSDDQILIEDLTSRLEDSDKVLAERTSEVQKWKADYEWMRDCKNEALQNAQRLAQERKRFVTYFGEAQLAKALEEEA